MKGKRVRITNMVINFINGEPVTKQQTKSTKSSKTVKTRLSQDEFKFQGEKMCEKTIKFINNI